MLYPNGEPETIMGQQAAPGDPYKTSLINGTVTCASWADTIERRGMCLKQSDLFQDTCDEFKQKVMQEARPVSYNVGHILFREGDPAVNLFILVEGRVKLKISGAERTVYVVSQEGECFGWSCLLDRDSYSAAAECIEPTELLLIGRENFKRVLDQDPVNGLIFFKSLARMIGKRLLYTYLNFAWF
jgi:CRP/FNR family transcriptional regulator, cyclic AMP receptor protein